jgi:hypothetical protein
MAAGDAVSDLKWVIGIVIALGLIWFVTGGPARYTATSGPFLQTPSTASSTLVSRRSWFDTPSLPRVPGGGSGAGSGIGGSNNYPATAPGAARTPSLSDAKQFSLESGNARYVYQSNDEYIVLNYRGQTPVNITGWYLTNGTGSRNYEVGSGLARGTSAVAVIPRVAKLFDPRLTTQATSDLILSPGDRVYIYSGSLSPKITGVASNSRASTQLNICSGYLDNSFRFSCPRPADWPGVNNLPQACYDYVKNLQSCHEPEFKQNTKGQSYVDNQPDNLTGQCRNFVVNSFNYNGCVAVFSQQADFYRPEWRVYLDRPLELWAKDREIVSLYDQAGHLVSQINW